jgi:peptide/nickel transport system substrate-binding protein
MLATMASSCSRPNANDGPRAVQTLRIGLRSEPSSLDPLELQGSMATFVGGVAYAYLLTSDGSGRLVPDAAREVPTIANGGVSRDGLRITYHLRPGMRWQDGVPITARDCAFTFSAIVNPLNDVASREGYDRVSSVDVINTSTLVVRLRRPFSPIVDLFLTTASNYPILPAHVWGAYRDLNRAPFERRSVGSGPFELTGWQHGEQMMFAANDTYFDGAPGFKRLVVLFIPSDTTMLNELRTGELDAVPNMDDPSIVSELRQIPRLRVYVHRLSGIMALVLNVRNGATTDPHVRSALEQAIDVARITHNASDGVYSSGDALRGMFGRYFHPTRDLPYDLSAARATLDAAGWRVSPEGTRERNGQRLSLVLAISNAAAMNAVIAVQIQSELREAGIDVVIRSYAPAEFLAPAASGGPLFGHTFNLALIPMIFSPAGPEAGSYLTCGQRAPEGLNFSGFCDPAWDKLYEDSVRSFDVSRQDSDVAAMEREFTLQTPWIPLYQLRGIAAMPERLSGFAPSMETPFVGMQRWRTIGVR